MSHLPEMQEEKETAGSKEAERNRLVHEKEMPKMPLPYTEKHSGSGSRMELQEKYRQGCF